MDTPHRRKNWAIFHDNQDGTFDLYPHRQPIQDFQHHDDQHHDKQSIPHNHKHHDQHHNQDNVPIDQWHNEDSHEDDEEYEQKKIPHSIDWYDHWDAWEQYKSKQNGYHNRPPQYDIAWTRQYEVWANNFQCEIINNMNKIRMQIHKPPIKNDFQIIENPYDIEPYFNSEYNKHDDEWFVNFKTKPKEQDLEYFSADEDPPDDTHMIYNARSFRNRLKYEHYLPQGYDSDPNNGMLIIHKERPNKKNNAKPQTPSHDIQHRRDEHKAIRKKEKYENSQRKNTTSDVWEMYSPSQDLLNII
jgi:hypothetical protein